MIDTTRYTSGRIAIANLAATIDGLERRRSGAASEELLSLSRLLFLRGDLLGRIADHDRAEAVANDAIALCPDRGMVFFICAQIDGRFHRFAEAFESLDRAHRAGFQPDDINRETAALLQATGRYTEALKLREWIAQREPGIHSLGALASLLAEMGDAMAAENCYTDALESDRGASPLPCAQLLFERGVNAMRQRELDRAEASFAALQLILPGHVPGPGHRAEIALARGELDRASALITPLLNLSDDPEYRATHADILAARGDRQAAAREAARAAAAYDRLLKRRPEAYADHAAAFFMGIGDQPQRALDLAVCNCKLRDTPRARDLLSRAQQRAATCAQQREYRRIIA